MPHALHEFDLIERYFRPLAKGFPGALDLRDDAALVRPPPGMQCVITTDMLQEGVHFFGHEKASHIAQKTLRVNLSDLAGKGAVPHCYFLSLGFDETVDEAWIADFAAGLVEDQAQYGIALAGGDTTRCKGMLSLSITAIGLVEEGKMLTRCGAKAGDMLYISGTVGDAALGLALLKGEFAGMPEQLREMAIERYYLPQPRTQLAASLHGATGGMDISDGIFQDTGHMLSASGVGAEVLLDAIPLSEAMRWIKRNEPARWLALLGGGDDYEILRSAPSLDNRHLTRIGRIVKGSGLHVLDSMGKPVTAPEGYRHGLGRVVGP